MNRAQRRIAAWIACFAVLLASLAPSISHALVAAGLSDGMAWMQHSLPEAQPPAVPDDTPCQASEEHDRAMQGHAHAGHAHDHGLMESAAPASHASHAPASHAPSLHFEHCPFCFTHAGTFGLAPVVDVIVPLAVGTAVLPFLFHHAPRPLFVWTAAQPRAPPAFS